MSFGVEKGSLMKINRHPLENVFAVTRKIPKFGKGQRV